MTTVKLVVLAWLTLSSVQALCAADPPKPKAKAHWTPHWTGRQSWYALLADPRKYDNEVMTLSGFLVPDKEYPILYPSVEDANNRRTESSILLTFSDPKLQATLANVPRMNVIVTGVFSVREPVPGGGHHLEDTEEYCLAFWKIEEFATDSPFRELFAEIQRLPSIDEVRKFKNDDLSLYPSSELASFVYAMSVETPRTPEFTGFVNGFPKKGPDQYAYIVSAIQYMEAALARIVDPSHLSVADICHLGGNERATMTAPAEVILSYPTDVFSKPTKPEKK
jgi:hypothetical protein